MLASLNEIRKRIPLKIRFSDLLEYPVINYFQYRNNGFLDDIQLTPDIVNEYLRFYRKDPRKIFMPKSKPLKIQWSKVIDRGLFHHSVGSLSSPYIPIVKEAFKDPKFNSVRKMYIHRYYYNRKIKKKNTAVLFIHGYAESHFFFHEQFYFRFLNNQFDSNIFALELPYHFRRQTHDSPFSGAYFLNGNPVRMVEAFRQSIHEIKLIIDYLQEKYDRVVLYGGSLGGHLVAHISQLVNNIDIIAALASPFLIKLATKTNIVPIARKSADQINPSHFKILYPVNMKYYTPHTTNKNTAIIGGEYDRIVPFEMAFDLAKMLNKPLFSYPGGHLTILLWIRSLLRQIDRLFKESK